MVSDRTLDQRIRLTGKVPSDPAIAARIPRLAGKTWRECKGMDWVTNKGATRKYGVTDFKYDLSQSVITVEAPASPAPISTRVASAVLASVVSFAFLSQTGAEPCTRKEALARGDWPEWWQAELQEIGALEKLNCWEYVPINFICSSWHTHLPL